MGKNAVSCNDEKAFLKMPISGSRNGRLLECNHSFLPCPNIHLWQNFMKIRSVVLCKVANPQTDRHTDKCQVEHVLAEEITVQSLSTATQHNLLLACIYKLTMASYTG